MLSVITNGIKNMFVFNLVNKYLIFIVFLQLSYYSNLLKPWMTLIGHSANPTFSLLVLDRLATLLSLTYDTDELLLLTVTTVSLSLNVL